MCERKDESFDECEDYFYKDNNSDNSDDEENYSDDDMKKIQHNFK